MCQGVSAIWQCNSIKTKRSIYPALPLLSVFIKMPDTANILFSSLILRIHKQWNLITNAQNECVVPMQVYVYICTKQLKWGKSKCQSENMFTALLNRRVVCIKDVQFVEFYLKERY